MNTPTVALLDCANALAQALPTLTRLQGKTFVIKYGGNAMTEPALQAAFAQDIALLQLMGIRPVVVHGGGPQIETALAQLGKAGEFKAGMRVTDQETLQIVKWVLAGQVQQEIVGLIQQAGGKAIGLTGCDGGLIRAKKLVPQSGDDLGFVGDIQAIDTRVIDAVRSNGFIPVISPIGVDEHQQSYNINADVLASEIAKALHAQGLLMLTNIAGVLDKSGQLCTELGTAQLEALIADGTISGGMIPKIAGALEAAKSGVSSVHIVDGRKAHATFIEVLSQQGSGTIIRA